MFRASVRRYTILPIAFVSGPGRMLVAGVVYGGGWAFWDLGRTSISALQDRFLQVMVSERAGKSNAQTGLKRNRGGSRL